MKPLLPFRAPVVPDYEKAMKRGFIDIQNEAKAKLAGLDLTNSGYLEKGCPRSA